MAGDATEALDIIRRLLAANDRFAIFSHEIDQSVGDETPVTRQELVDAFSALSGFLIPLTDAVEWMLQTILASVVTLSDDDVD